MSRQSLAAVVAVATLLSLSGCAQEAAPPVTVTSAPVRASPSVPAIAARAAARSIAPARVVTIGGGESYAAPAPAGGTVNAASGEATFCPMAVPDTIIHTLDTAMGMTVTFTTTTSVPDLQRRVRDLADRMNTGAQAPTAMPSMMVGMPPMHVSVRDTVTGAILDAAPMDSADLQTVRDHLRDGAAEMMVERDCRVVPARSR